MKGWKTLIFNFVAMIAPLLDVIVFLGAIPEFGQVIPTEYYPIYTLAVALANKGLRMVTTTPVGQKYAS